MDIDKLKRMTKLMFHTYGIFIIIALNCFRFSFLVFPTVFIGLIYVGLIIRTLNELVNQKEQS